MDVARLNFSPRQPRRPRADLRWVREPATSPAAAVGVLADLQGPKIRLGTFADGPLRVATGEIGHDHQPRRPRHPRPGLHDLRAGCAGDVSVGDRLLIDDGRVGVGWSTSTGNDVQLPGHRGRPGLQQQGRSRCPASAVSVPAMSEKDDADLRFAMGLRVDLVALSFVRSPEDIKLRARDHGRVRASACPVLAKIEKPQAVDNLEAIVEAFDGLMVARGDLGVEMPLERGPAGAEARRAGGPRAGQAGHRRHPDARLDDQNSAADPRRGLATSPTPSSTAPTR